MVVRVSASPTGTAPAMMSARAAGRGPSIRRLTIGYAAVLLAGSLAIAVAGTVAGAVAPKSAAPVGGGVTEADRGGQLFLTSCAACHGPQGAGTANGPDIRNAGAALADFMLRTGRMPLADPAAPAQRGTTFFSAVDRAAIVAYVASLGQGPAIPDVVTSAADVNAGRNLFVANCAACHGPSGGGGAVGGGFVAPALTQADPTTVGEAVVSGPGPMPRFSFSQDELNNLAAYVEYLRDAPNPGGWSSPAVGPVTEGFIAGMTLLGLLVVARWVAVRRDPDEPSAHGAETAAGRPDDRQGGDADA